MQQKLQMTMPKTRPGCGPPPHSPHEVDMRQLWTLLVLLSAPVVDDSSVHGSAVVPVTLVSRPFSTSVAHLANGSMQVRVSVSSSDVFMIRTGG